MTYFPSVWKDVFLEQMRPACLKHLWRCVIRKHLLDVDEHGNLFYRISAGSR